ncbi:MAG: hypothetical protein WD734_05880 [Dehalococcoidia bacterium]
MTNAYGPGPYTDLTDDELRHQAAERGLTPDKGVDRAGLIALLDARDQADAAERMGTDAYGGAGDQSADEASLVGSTDEGPGGVPRPGEPSPPSDEEDRDA